MGVNLSLTGSYNPVNDITTQYTQYKINKGEAITAIGSTAIVEAAISEGVVGILT